MLASAILGVLGLRLVRCNCPDCSQPYEPASQLRVLPKNYARRRSSGMARAARVAPTPVFRASAVTELLVVDEPFREAVLKKNSTSALEEIAIQQGMRTLWQTACTASSTPDLVGGTVRVLAADMM